MSISNLVRRMLDRMKDGRPLSFEERAWIIELRKAKRAAAK